MSILHPYLKNWTTYDSVRVSLLTYYKHQISEQYFFTPFLYTNISVSTLIINASSSEVGEKKKNHPFLNSIESGEHNKNENKYLKINSYKIRVLFAYKNKRCVGSFEVFNTFHWMLPVLTFWLEGDKQK